MESDGQIRPVLEFQTQVGRLKLEPWLTKTVIVDQIPENLEKAFMHDYIRSVSAGWTAEQVSKTLAVFYPRSKLCLLMKILIQCIIRSGHW